MKRNKIIMTVASLLLVASMLLPFAACVTTEVSAIELDRGSLSLDIGEEVTLYASIFPADAVGVAVRWKSSDANIATVDSNGKVKGVAVGTATVKASAGSKETTCSVTVYDSSQAEVAVTNIRFDKADLPLTADNRIGTITATVEPSNATDPSLSWTTSAPQVATVQNGVVTAVGAGVAFIVATSNSNSSVTQSCRVTVTGDFSGDDNPPDTTVHVESVTVAPTQLTLVEGRTSQLTATVLPEDATDKSVTWSSSDNSVATVDSNGIVTAHVKGTATITVVTTDGQLDATCAVTVEEPAADEVPVTGVTLNKNTLALIFTRSETLTATVLPANATDKNVIWSSDNPSVASVDGTGKVTAVAVGSAKITVTTSDGGKTAECDVTVSYAATSQVSISPSTLSLGNIGATSTLSATVRPSTANPSVNWTTSDDSVVTVENGVVTAIGYGTATVTATSADGKSATCSVTVKLSSDDLYVKKVSSLSTRTIDFIMGMDASAVPSLEDAGVTYKNFAGKTQDVFEILRDNGITDIRIRIWNNPYTDSSSKYGAGKSYGGGNCDIANAVKIAKRCADAGLGVIIDFHYSDFWADPGKYTIPKAWASYTTSQVTSAIESFTTDCLTQIKNTGVKITMVQIGNETTTGLAGSTDWNVISQYMNAGSKAVRAVTGTVANGGAKVAVHFTDPQNKNYSSKAYNIRTVDYDVFGTSYYPFWHGTLSNLAEQLSSVRESYNKEVMVLETSYGFTNADFDGCGNTAITAVDYPLSVQGQANSVRAVIDTVAGLGEWGLGVCYWEGTWIAASTSSSGSENAALCLKYGCGWANYYANEYDKSAPSQGGWGGCVIDNQAFFRSDGTPLESLKVFALARIGNETMEVVADSYDKQEGYYTVNTGTIVLPTTAWAYLSDGSHVAISVRWVVTAEQLEAYLQTPGKYEIEGYSLDYGGTCYYTLWILNPNLLTGGSFEADEDITGYGATDNFIQTSGLGDWKLDYTKATSALQLYVSTDSGNARMGSQSFHFWDSGKVNFTLSQTVDLSKLTTYGAGKYSCRFDIMGGDGSNMDIHAYIKVTYNDGTSDFTVSGNVVQLTGWLDWQTTSASVSIDDLSKVKSIEVGISVYAEVSGNGPWGNIDNCQFYFDNN
ncbi:MAG: glycosyl hydrolase 53 family protein [Clostridiales bacterium]|nr:glycosyl hydrolase 53 family protein [Clostridiales bacterium]